nr:MAG TPA: hypothetical protein [Caudoviricetes sp.]
MIRNIREPSTGSLQKKQYFFIEKVTETVIIYISGGDKYCKQLYTD